MDFKESHEEIYKKSCNDCLYFNTGNMQKHVYKKRLQYALTATIKHFCVLLFLISWQAHAEVFFTASEKQIISSLTVPLPVKIPQDLSNAYQNDPNAKVLGKQLFFDVRLSGNKKISCATCHQLDNAFTDGLPQARGLAKGQKNTPTLLNSAFNRWFFWDGRSDSLWSQALNPITHRAEMGGKWPDIYQLFITDSILLTLYNQTFPSNELHEWVNFSEIDQNRFKSNVGKALAAFQSDITQFNSRFDQYARSINSSDQHVSNELSRIEKQGLKLFIGKAQCIVCHSGPNFSDSEFHDIRLPLNKRLPEAGRYDGITHLKKNKMNVLGQYSDLTEENKAYGDKTLYLTQKNSQWSAYKTPTLRNITQTAPYMHNGSFKKLDEVIKHYSTFENATPNHHKNGLLTPLHLSTKEKTQLMAFLESLTGTLTLPSY